MDHHIDVTGKHSVPSVGRWMESFILCMSLCGIYIYAGMYVPYVHNAGVHGRFYRLDLKK